MHIDDVGVRLPGPGGADLDLGADANRLVEALEAIASGDAEIDSLNRLVLAAGLSWVQVRLLRAYRRYRRQAGSALTDDELDDPLVAFPEVAAGLVGYFEARLEPGGGGARTGKEGVTERQRVVDGLDGVVHRQQDVVLRDYLALIDATVRTSYFLRTTSGRPPATVTIKLDSGAVPDLPEPRPMVDAFVHGVAVEGIHLRFGRVARGGIRWSDRPDDFRTEILDLAAAQVKKNAIIVPTGAKGGFVCRRPGTPSADGVRSAYATFIGALLDITDNLVDGRVVPPPGVTALDGEDPYLVVAADRGTATFSDLANELAAEHGFWLGDAFASAGPEDTTTRPWASPPAGPGWRCGATSTSWASTSRPRPSGWPGWATCPATCSATACSRAGPSSSWPPSTTATSSSTPTPTRPDPSRSAGGWLRSARRAGTTTTAPPSPRGAGSGRATPRRCR